MFEKIAAPADPILGLTDIFRADARPNKNQFRDWRL